MMGHLEHVGPQAGEIILSNTLDVAREQHGTSRAINRDDDRLVVGALVAADRAVDAQQECAQGANLTRLRTHHGDPPGGDGGEQLPGGWCLVWTGFGPHLRHCHLFDHAEKTGGMVSVSMSQDDQLQFGDPVSAKTIENHSRVWSTVHQCVATVPTRDEDGVTLSDIEHRHRSGGESRTRSRHQHSDGDEADHDQRAPHRRSQP